MKDISDILFPERWAICTIWQGCQIKTLTGDEHSFISQYYAFKALGSLGLIITTILVQSL